MKGSHTDKKRSQPCWLTPSILLARPGRLEHPTCGFVVRRSIHLSYGRPIPFCPISLTSPISPSLRAMAWRRTSSGGYRFFPFSYLYSTFTRSPIGGLPLGDEYRLGAYCEVNDLALVALDADHRLLDGDHLAPVGRIFYLLRGAAGPCAHSEGKRRRRK